LGYSSGNADLAVSLTGRQHSTILLDLAGGSCGAPSRPV
jgi:hypothetical protein